jgi:hypothetical protein
MSSNIAERAALLGPGWELSPLNVRNTTVAAASSAGCLSILDGPGEWVQFDDNTDPYALVLTEDLGQTVTLLAAGLDRVSAFEQWQRYMREHLGECER